MRCQFFIISAFLFLILISVVIVGILKLNISGEDFFEEKFFINVDDQLNKFLKIDRDFLDFVANNTNFLINYSTDENCYNISLISSDRYYVYNCIRLPKASKLLNVDCNENEWYSILFINTNISERYLNIDPANDFYICKALSVRKLYLYFKLYTYLSNTKFYNITINKTYNVSIINCSIYSGRELVEEICCGTDFIEISLKNISTINISIEFLSEEDSCYLKLKN